MSETKHKRSPLGLKTRSASGLERRKYKGSLSLRMKPAERNVKSEIENGQRKTKRKKSRESVESEYSSPEEVVSEETPKRESSSDSKKKKRSKKTSKKKTESKEYILPPESEEVSSEEDDHLTRVPSKQQQRKSKEAKKKKERTKRKNDKKSKTEASAIRGSQEPWSDRRFSDNVPPSHTSLHETQKGIEERTPTRSTSGKVPFKEGSPSLHKVSSRGSQKRGSQRKSSPSLHKVSSRGSQKRGSQRKSSSSLHKVSSRGFQRKGSPSLHKVTSRESLKEPSSTLHKVSSRGSQRKGSPSLHKVTSRESLKDPSSTLHKVSSRGSQRKGSSSLQKVTSRGSLKDPSPSLHKVSSRGSQTKVSPSLQKVTSRGSLKDPSSTSHKSNRSGSLKESSPLLHEVDSRKTDKKDEDKRTKENLEKKYRSMKIIFRDPRTKQETIVIIDDEDDGQVPTGQAFFPQQQSPKQTALSTQDLPEHQECPSGDVELIIRSHKNDKDYKNSKHVQYPSTNNKSTAKETRSGRSTTEDRRKTKKSGQTIRESSTDASKYPDESISKHSQLSNEKSGFKSPSINEDTIHKNRSLINSESLQPEVCKCMHNMEERGVNTIYNAHFSPRFPPCFRKVRHPSVTLVNNDLYINNKHDQYKICNGYDGELRLNNLKLLKGRNDMYSDNSSECSFTCIKHDYNRNLGHISNNHLILNEVYLKTINENVKQEKKFIKNSKNKEEDTEPNEEIRKSKKFKFDERFENDKMLLPKQMTQLSTILPTKSSAMIDALDTVLQYSTTPDEFPPLPSGLLYYYSKQSTSSQITDDLGKSYNKNNNTYSEQCPKKSFWKKLFTKIFHNKQFKQKNMGVQTFKLKENI